MNRNEAENTPGGSRECEEVREIEERGDENDALSWYFNRSVSQPWDRLLEVEECIEKEFYKADKKFMLTG